MDDRRFDSLSRLAATAETRRTILRALGGVFATTLAGGPGVGAAPARCRKRKKIGQQCKLDNGAKCPCKGGAKCQGGVCTCPNDTVAVNGKCKELPLCLENGADCSEGSSASCCSGFCTYEGQLGEVEPTCCVPPEGACTQTSDCCVNGPNTQRCQLGRCCLAAGTTCADPTGTQTAFCCLGLVCDVDGTRQCG